MSAVAQEANRKICKAAQRGLMDGEAGVRPLYTELSKNGGDLEFSEKPYFRTAFHEAVHWNQEPVVKFLFEKGASVNCEDYLGRTPLHSASQYGYRNLVEFLIDKKSEIKQDNEGKSPLHLATEFKRDEIMRILIEKSGNLSMPNLTDENGLTAGHMSAFQGLGLQTWWLYCKGAWKNRFAVEDTVDNGNSSDANAADSVIATVAAVTQTQNTVTAAQKTNETGPGGKEDATGPTTTENEAGHQTEQPVAAG